VLFLWYSFFFPCISCWMQVRKSINTFINDKNRKQLQEMMIVGMNKRDCIIFTLLIVSFAYLWTMTDGALSQNSDGLLLFWHKKRDYIWHFIQAVEKFCELESTFHIILIKRVARDLWLGIEFNQDFLLHIPSQ